MTRPRRAAATVLAMFAGAAHARPLQHAFDPAGPQAAHIETLWHVLLAVCTAVFVAVLLAFVWALLRAPRATEETEPDLTALLQTNRRAQHAIVGAIAVSIVLLLVLITASLVTDRALARLPSADPVQIQVVARQWWWYARYGGDDAADMFVTANELHIPVGRPVATVRRGVRAPPRVVGTAVAGV